MSQNEVKDQKPQELWQNLTERKYPSCVYPDSLRAAAEHYLIEQFSSPGSVDSNTASILVDTAMYILNNNAWIPNAFFKREEEK